MKNKPIEVLYSFVDGAHFFTSEDESAKGLCAASTDLHAAFTEVAYQLKILFEKNLGVKDMKFKSLTDFSTLKAWADKEVEAAQKAKRDNIFIPRPTAEMKWQEAA